jgi:AraC-like DNA-binding protein
MTANSIQVDKIERNDALDELTHELGVELSAGNTLLRFSDEAAVPQEETDKASSNIDLYYEKIKEAEAILLSHLQKSPPRISVIARTLALSESTLKRYFKLVYGKSIYEYYLNRKMELARTILLQNPRSVTEMAELMGYEKVSHFIEIFKKHHGCSPGSIRKKITELIS